MRDSLRLMSDQDERWILGQPHSAGVVETAEMLHGHATGTMDGMQWGELERAWRWLSWRVNDGWVEPPVTDSPDSAEYDSHVREMAKVALRMFNRAFPF